MAAPLGLRFKCQKRRQCSDVMKPLLWLSGDLVEDYCKPRLGSAKHSEALPSEFVYLLAPCAWKPTSQSQAKRHEEKCSCS